MTHRVYKSMRKRSEIRIYVIAITEKIDGIEQNVDVSK